jgi:hypothetical protein
MVLKTGLSMSDGGMNNFSRQVASLGRFGWGWAEVKPGHLTPWVKRQGRGPWKGFPRSVGQFSTGDRFCIYKSSSAELSEAINSMHAWYARADMCFAYLNDVTAEQSDLEAWRRIQGNGYPEVTNEINYASSTIGALKASKWFTRSWTLQEPVAPSFIYFVHR